VIYAVEEGFEVNVNHPSLSLLYVSLCFTHGIVRAAPRPEAMAVRIRSTNHVMAERVERRNLACRKG
jgi:hypothetical protein